MKTHADQVKLQSDRLYVLGLLEGSLKNLKEAKEISIEDWRVRDGIETSVGELRGAIHYLNQDIEVGR